MRPIGIFDSGIGGLSVYLNCKRLLPRENFIYLDDGAFAPYGDKSPGYVTARAVENTRRLLDCGAKAVVIACNTATTVAIAEVRRLFTGHIIGTEPAVVPALKATTGKLLVLATPLTCATLKARHLSDRLVFSPQNSLAAEIENAAANDLPVIAQRVTQGDYEGVVLGCTHYSFLAPYIKDKTVFDGAEGVARRLKALLDQQSDNNI